MSTPHLGCRDLHVQYYGRDTLALDNVNLTVDPGDSVLFLGSSGCGKSTLMNVLAGVIPRSIDAHLKGEVWRPDRVGMLFQDPESQFCMLNVDDEIAFSLENCQVAPEKMPGLIQNLKRQVGLDHLAAETPIHSLSGGMKQRLALATVLALEPEVLFLDEPTAQLDPVGTKQVLDDIYQLKRRHTLILIEHKLDGLMDWVDRAVLFSPEGEIIGDDTPANILECHGERMTAYGIWKPRIWPASWADVLQDTDSERVKQWEPVQKHPPTKEPLLEVIDATLAYGKGQPIWKEVSVDIQRGEWVSVLGPNGSGKSTFLKMLMGMLPLQQGKVRYPAFPASIKNQTPEALSEHVGFVFQNPEHQFITDTVYDEVAFIGKVEKWPQSDIAAKVKQLLHDFHLYDLSEANPYTLSIGQKRRLSVASMLLKEHRLLLLDEPTFGQDAATAHELMHYLTKLHESGTTIMMATHDVEIAYQYSTKVLVFAEGRLVYCGSPKPLFTNRTLLERARLQEPLHIEYLRRKSESTAEVIHA